MGRDTRLLRRTLRASGRCNPVDRHGYVGAIRLTVQAVALVLKRHAARPRLDPEQVAGHSLRSGLLTSTSSAGVPGHIITAQTGLRDTAMLHPYVREGSLFRENAVGVVGL
jgi:hypothetical protein